MRKRINDGWRFCKLPMNSSPEDAGAARWQEVDIPHDWLIWQADRLYESADAWYQRFFEAEEISAPHCLVRFDGVYMDCDVLLNGEPVCSHAYGYTAFDADLSGRAKPGRNELTVHIRHRSPNTRWYSGSGIFRDVELVSLPETCLAPDSLYVTTRPENDGTWRVDIEAEVIGNGDAEFRCALKDAEGRIVAETGGAREGNRVHAELKAAEPRLWSLEHPVLYTLEYALGEERESIRTGFRSTRFDPDEGFFLNGEHVKMKGVCLHHDLGALGAAFHEKAARRQLRIMREMGVNAIRTSHNPPAAKFLDLCDEMGFLVIDEAFDMWERPKTEFDYARFFPEHEAEDVAAWVRRDRCHPCVILWSIGNEIYDMQADDRGRIVTGMLTEQVRSHDPKEHAKVTFGSNYMPWEGAQRCAEIVKIPGYNYAEKYYAEHHAKHPDWVIYGSETASVLSSRGIYHFPMRRTIMSEADLQCSALGNSNTSWGATDLRHCIVDDLNIPYSLGQFIWSGFDYIGEPTPYHTRSCYFGQTDTAGFPKDAWYLFKSLWNPEPMIHIGVSWDWNPGQMIDIPVMTNCAEAELFLNGVSLGRQQADARDPEKCLPVWQAPYTAGELKAVGYGRNGEILAEDTRFTPGDTAALRLESEDPVLRSDGWDMTFVTISAVDAKGHPVDNARDRFFVSVEGGGVLAGIDNGDSTDPEGYKASSRRLFSGKALVMVRSNGEEKDTVIRVFSPSCGETFLTLGCEKAAHVQGVSCVQRIKNSELFTDLISEEKDQGGFPSASPALFGCDRLFKTLPPNDGTWTEKPVRKLEIRLKDSGELSPEHRECAFEWQVLPREAGAPEIMWQVTNDLGVETPNLTLAVGENSGTVRAEGDGSYYLRGLCGNAKDHPEIISQIEISVTGMGSPALDPYEPVCAGLYDLHEGDIGAGNEKGISFARDGVSMAGFSRVDFGRAGSDRLTMPVFALDGDAYDLEMLVGEPGGELKKFTTLRYQKPSIWNVYQEETWQLPERLRGVKSIAFRLDRKVHLKSFVFEKQSRAEQWLTGADADEIYGDDFRRDGTAVTGIGNNVTLVFRELDFAEAAERTVEIEGRTPLEVNTITLKLTDAEGNTMQEIAGFRGTEPGIQRFPLKTPAGPCELAMVFLPGSQFDFRGIRFV